MNASGGKPKRWRDVLEKNELKIITVKTEFLMYWLGEEEMRIT